MVQRALGGMTRTKGGVISNSKLAAAVGESNTTATASGFSAGYSDAGLVGAFISASPKDVESVSVQLLRWVTKSHLKYLLIFCCS